MDPAARPLVDLTRAFLAGEIDAPTFETRYLETFKGIPALGEKTFLPLNDLFIACDRFVADPELRDPDDLDETGPRVEAERALGRLGAATSRVLTLWNRASALPLGSRVFSFVFARKAPYFATVRPRFVTLEPNRAELVIPKRRRVHNHLGTVHAIALCNGLEAAMGALAEATVPAGKRWIPQGMEVAYTAQATGDVTCIAETDPEQWSVSAMHVPVRVRGQLADGTVVVEGVIRLWVTTAPLR